MTPKLPLPVAGSDESGRRSCTSWRSAITGALPSRPGRPLPGQDFHLLEQRTFARRTWTSTPATRLHGPSTPGTSAVTKITATDCTLKGTLALTRDSPDSETLRPLRR